MSIVRNTCTLAAALLLVLVAACAETTGEPRNVSTTPGSAPASSSTPTPGSSLPGSSAVPPSVPEESPVVELEALPYAFEQPVYVVAPPGDASRLFVVEKGGRVRVIAEGELIESAFLDLSGEISDGGERGLLSIAFHPDFGTNGRLFVDYTDTSGATRVVGFTVAGGPGGERVDMSTRVDLLTIPQPYSNHNGGQLQFGPDGELYVGMGDGGSGGDPQGRAQDPASLLGKLLRLDVDRGAPQAEIFVVGLRNPWRFSFDRETGDLWIGDVGQSAWEEIDHLPAGTPAGANMGWNAYEGSHAFDERAIAQLDGADVVWPVAEYDHSVGNSVTGGYVYRGTAIDGLRGRYVFGDYSSGRIWTMKGPGGDPEPLAGADRLVQQLASFGEDASGELYLVSLQGAVYRLVPAP